MNRRTVVASVMDTADDLIESGYAETAGRMTDLARRLAMLSPSKGVRHEVVAAILDYANDLDALAQERNSATLLGEAKALTVFAQNLADTPFDEDPATSTPEMQAPTEQAIPLEGDLNHNEYLDPLEMARLRALDQANQIQSGYGDGEMPEEHQRDYDMLMNFYRDTDLHGLGEEEEQVDATPAQSTPAVAPRTPQEQGFLHSLMDSGIILR